MMLITRGAADLYRLDPKYRLDPVEVFGSMLWETSYSPSPGSHYYHYFWAQDADSAEDVAKALGGEGAYNRGSTVDLRFLINNVPNPVRDLTRLFRAPTSMLLAAKAQHAVAHLAFMGLRSGVLTAEDTVGDQGFVHQLAHFMHFNRPGPIKKFFRPEKTKARLMEQTRKAILSVPGFAPRNLDLWVMA